jgi:hypothetical protein
MVEAKLEDSFKAAKPIRHRINVFLRDNNVSYTVALIAMTQVMMDIAVYGLGQTEQDARKLLMSLFLTDDMKN